MYDRSLMTHYKSISRVDGIGLEEVLLSVAFFHLSQFHQYSVVK